MAAAVTVNGPLDGHVALDVECLDRIYLNGHVPNLQIIGPVVRFGVAAVGADFADCRTLEGVESTGSHGAGQSQQQIEPDLFSLLLVASSAGRDLRGLLLVAGTCSAGGFWGRSAVSSWPRGFRGCSMMRATPTLMAAAASRV
jgi:hypothetical protein